MANLMTILQPPLNKNQRVIWLSIWKVNQRKIDKGAFEKGRDSSPKDIGQRVRDENDGHSECFSSRIERGVVGLTLKEGANGDKSVDYRLKLRTGTTEDCINQNVGKLVPVRTWKRIARQCHKSNNDKQLSSMDRRPSMDLDGVTLNKRQCMDFSNSHEHENLEVVAGSQHH